MQAAGIRAQDQAFNQGQDFNWESMIQGRLNDNFSLQSGLNSANWQKQFAQQSNRLGMNQARQQAWQNIRLALLSRMD
jgi:hypothetical protein